MSELYGYRPEVAVALTPDFRAGGPRPDLSRFLESIDDAVAGESEAVEIRTDLLAGLLETLIEDERWSPPAGSQVLTDDQKNKLDGWLAPRLHAALRIPRRIASDRRFWAWLAIERMNPYLVKRFTESGKPSVPEWRYTGILLRNGLARLWWGAELVRNGPSYEHVPYVFRRTRTAQWVLELDYSRYRPAPIAFVRVVEGIPEGEQLSDDRMRLLSKRVNALLTLHALESMGLDEMENEIDSDWYLHRPELTEITSDNLPAGPEDGFAAEGAIESLETWFRKLAKGELAVGSA